MRNRIISILALSLLIGLPGLANADEPGDSEPIVISPESAAPAPAPAQDDSWKFIHQRGKWLPQFEFTGRPGSKELHGFSPDLVIPIAQNSRNLIFTSVIGNLFWDDGEDFQEINVGLGYRRLMGDSSWILGGYAYWDRIWSQYDNTFDQAALGIEGLSWNWEGRVNGYIAPEDTQFVPSRGVSQATLVGNRLTMTSWVEQAMSGFDAEVGWRLPFFGEDTLLSDTRIFAGGFYFDAPDLKGFGGPMTRFETRMWEIPFLPEESRLTLGTSYRWDDYRGHQVQGQIGVRIPLGRPNRTVALNKVERRMVDRPVRDISIVTRQGNATSERVRTQTAVIEDAYFFDYETDGDGSFDDPMNPYAAAATGENNLLIGLANTGAIELVEMDGAVETLEGQTWMGGGTELMVWGVESGQPALYEAPGTAATFCCDDTALELAGNNTVAGLHFEYFDTALWYQDIDDTMFDIYNNHFRWMGTGIEIGTIAELTAYVHDNLFEEMGTGVYVYSDDPAAFDITVEAYGNDFSNMGYGLAFDLYPGSPDQPSSFSLNAHDNSFAHMERGIGTYVAIGEGSEYTHTSQIVNNTFFDVISEDEEEPTDYHLMILGYYVAGETNVDVDVDGNRSTASSGFAVVEIEGLPDGAVNLDVTNNEVVGTGRAVLLDVDNGPDVNINVAGNEIRGVSGDLNGGDGDHDGIKVRVYDPEGENGTAVTIVDNILEDIEDDAIDVRVEYSPDTSIDVSNNVIRRVGGDGIHIFMDENGHSSGNTVTVTGNSIDDVGGDGIDVTLEWIDWGDLMTTLEITGNEVNRSGRGGILVDLDHMDDAVVTIDGNLVRHSSQDNEGLSGIEVNLISSADDKVTISNNRIERSESGHGVEIDIEDGSDFNEIVIDANTIEIVDESGVDIEISDGSDENSIDMNGNSIDVAETGVKIDSDAGLTYLNSDSDNTVDNADQDEEITGSFDGTLLVNGNEVPL